VIAITNEKGGVAKTTTAINLAEALVRVYGYRVLGVDTDPQGDMSKGLGLRTPEARLPSLANALTLDGLEAPEDAIHPTRVPGLDILPGHSNLGPLERVIARSEDPRREEMRLKQALDYIVETRDYDFIIIDLPPRGYSPLFSLALRATDTYIVPMQLKYFAADGVTGLFDAVNQFAAEHDHAPLLLGVLLTMVDYRLTATRDQVADMRSKYSDYLMSAVIRHNNDVEVAQSEGTSIFVERRGCWADRGYRELADEVLAKCRQFRLIPASH
jgi:chromosome partitioning protein